ncbi:MAG: kinase/pyrophosphorylase [Anaerolineae bacterium]|nr:MAG: kinase/pyrophosphorylase [Anaerolineae bacterium]
MTDRFPTPRAAMGSHFAEDGHDGADCAPVYIVTGGQGSSGLGMVHAILKQFPSHNIPVETKNFVKEPGEIDAVIQKAAADGGVIVHTLVVDEMRAHLLAACAAHGVAQVDLLGPLQEHLSRVLGVPALQAPGRYHELYKDFFQRIDAIEYTLSHDDGKNPDGWPEADILLVGPSRTSKTPLAYYLADHGWKVANYPVVLNIQPPAILWELDRRRVFCLDIDPNLSLKYRQQRQRTLGVDAVGADYTDPLKIVEELEFSRSLCKRGKFTRLEVTDTPVEGSSGEIERKMEERLGETRRLAGG